MSYRTHTCGQLRLSDVGAKVRLSGWIHNKRDHGGVLFIDLRDHYGLTQVVVYPDAAFQYDIGHQQKETVIRIDGEVIARTAENVNPKMSTGEVEVKVSDYEVLGPCTTLPFPIFPEETAPEETRLKYRFLDLRKTQLHQNVILRSKIISSLRRRMIELGVPVALGSDLNPGTCWCESMPFIIALACRYLHLTPAEAIVAATRHAAYASGVGDRVGSLEVGKQADIVILDLPDYRHLAYRFGTNPVQTVIKAGRVVVTNDA